MNDTRLLRCALFPANTNRYSKVDKVAILSSYRDGACAHSWHLYGAASSLPQDLLSEPLTVGQVSMIDFFLPYLPLEPVHLRELMRRRLVEEDRALRRLYATSLRWGDPELDFLLSKVRLISSSFLRTFERVLVRLRIERYTCQEFKGDASARACGQSSGGKKE